MLSYQILGSCRSAVFQCKISIWLKEKANEKNTGSLEVGVSPSECLTVAASLLFEKQSTVDLFSRDDRECH